MSGDWGGRVKQNSLSVLFNADSTLLLLNSALMSTLFYLFMSYLMMYTDALKLLSVVSIKKMTKMNSPFTPKPHDFIFVVSLMETAIHKCPVVKNIIQTHNCE